MTLLLLLPPADKPHYFKLVAIIYNLIFKSLFFDNYGIDLYHNMGRIDPETGKKRLDCLALRNGMTFSVDNNGRKGH